MNKIDYLILTALFELESPVALLFRDDVEEVFNLGKIKLDKDSLIQGINNLLKTGYIECIDKHGKKKIRTIVSGKESFNLGLSPKGGEVASTYLNINWEDYIKNNITFLNEEKCQWAVESKERRNLNKIIVYLMNQKITFEILKLSPWFPVYWKRLDYGYQISVQCSCEIYNKYREQKNK